MWAPLAKRVLERLGGDEEPQVGGVVQDDGFDRLRDLADLLQRIRKQDVARPHDDQPRSHGEGHVSQRVHVDSKAVHLREGPDAQSRELRGALGVVAVVAAVIRVVGQDEVIRLEEREVHGGVGHRGAHGPPLDVVRPEELLGRVDQNGFDLVDEVVLPTVGVVLVSRIPFRHPGCQVGVQQPSRAPRDEGLGGIEVQTRRRTPLVVSRREEGDPVGQCVRRHGSDRAPDGLEVLGRLLADEAGLGLQHEAQERAASARGQGPAVGALAGCSTAERDAIVEPILSLGILVPNVFL